jgi:hypothetical protein
MLTTSCWGGKRWNAKVVLREEGGKAERMKWEALAALGPFEACW